MSLAGVLLDAADPSRLMVKSGFAPDTWQRQLCLDAPARALLLIARQMGKSTVLAALAIHTAVYRAGAVIGVIAPTLRQSALLLRRIKTYLKHVGVRAVNNAATSLELANGSRIEAWPGNNPDSVRGDTLHLLLIDEGAWVLDETYNAVLPMLTMTGGKCLVASTPGGPGGWLFDHWNDEEDDEWQRIKVTAPECPRYTELDLARFRRSLGERAFATEFLCDWRSASDSIFTAADIAAILGKPDPDLELAMGLDEELGLILPAGPMIDFSAVVAAAELARRDYV